MGLLAFIVALQRVETCDRQLRNMVGPAASMVPLPVTQLLPHKGQQPTSHKLTGQEGPGRGSLKPLPQQSPHKVPNVVQSPLTASWRCSEAPETQSLQSGLTWLLKTQQT